MTSRKDKPGKRNKHAKRMMDAINTAAEPIPEGFGIYRFYPDGELEGKTKAELIAAFRNLNSAARGHALALDTKNDAAKDIIKDVQLRLELATTRYKRAEGVADVLREMLHTIIRVAAPHPSVAEQQALQARLQPDSQASSRPLERYSSQQWLNS